MDGNYRPQAGHTAGEKEELLDATQLRGERDEAQRRYDVLRALLESNSILFENQTWKFRHMTLNSWSGYLDFEEMVQAAGAAGWGQRDRIAGG